MNDLDLKYLIDYRQINRARNLRGFTIEDLAKRLTYISSRTVQVFCSENTLLKPPLIQALSAYLEIPEYQLFGEVPNTYVYQGRLIEDAQNFANLMNTNPIVDVKWDTAVITHSESFEKILVQIDRSEFEKGPLTSKENSRDSSNLSFQEKYLSFELNKQVFNDFCKNNDIQIWGIPIFKVFGLGASSFVWKTGVIIEFFKNQQNLMNERKPITIPNHLERVGEEKFYQNNKFKLEFQISALKARPIIQSMGNINFGDMETGIMIQGKSDTRVSRVNQDKNPDLLPIPTKNEDY